MPVYTLNRVTMLKDGTAVMLEILNDSGRVVKCERWVRTPIEE